jgi:uncharacterized protein (UPF0261 family)
VGGNDNRDSVRSSERSGSGGLAVLVIGTLDTKRVEIEFLADAIAAHGAAPLLLDSSTSAGEEVASRFPVIGRGEVAHAAGSSIEDVAELPRGEAIERMRGGVLELTTQLFVGNEIDAAICIGGAGTHLSGPAFQALPIGFPKMVVSPLASGRRQFEPYVGLRDVAVMHSVADIAGINDITEKVFNSAAGYIVGAAEAHREELSREGAVDAAPTVVVSMNGNTTRAMDLGRARLQGAGYAVVTFHANGVGGRALEDFVDSGRAAAVLDYTTTELGAEVVGGMMNAGPTRMETAGRKGVPQVLVPGCVDFITCGPLAETEEEFPGRVMFGHNPELTLVRLREDEMAELGAIFATKANLAVGPIAILVPREGFSVPDAEGGPFWDPPADEAFIRALLENLDSGVRVQVIDAHINDESFADAAVDELLALVDGVRRKTEVSARAPSRSPGA